MWAFYEYIVNNGYDRFDSILNPQDALTLTLIMRCTRLISFCEEVEDFAVMW